MQSINQSINHWFIKQLTNRNHWVSYTIYSTVQSITYNWVKI